MGKKDDYTVTAVSAVSAVVAWEKGVARFTLSKAKFQCV
jgi:hypothetical protein